MQINEIEQNSILLKLRKKAITGVNAKNFAAAIESLDGWSVSPVTVWIPDDTLRYKAKSTFPAFAHNTTGVGMADILLVPDDNRRVGHYVAVSDHKDVLAKAQAQLRNGTKNYRANVSALEQGPEGFNDSSFGFKFFVEHNVKALRVESPDEKTFDLVIKARGHDLPDFYFWGEHTGFFDAVGAALGMAPIVKKDPNAYTREGVIAGHCAICGREQATKNGKMVRHGYQRPGRGYLVGMCFGAFRDAYEVSAEACKEYIPVLEKVVVDTSKEIAKLQDGTSTPIYNRKTRFREVIPGDANYQKYVDEDIRQKTKDIRYASEDIDLMKGRIANWKKGELRTVGKNG